MTEAAVLSAGGPPLWTIPAGYGFLDELARQLALETGLADNPSALSDALIYVPNRRSARALALALYRAGGERPILPPDIRALGDLETDEPPHGTEEALANLGLPLSTGTRLGALASLVMAFYARRGLPLPVKSAIAAARELMRLLDQAALSGEVAWSRLPDLVEKSDLAHHWADSVAFLQIITDVWPDWLAAQGVSEPFQRRLSVAQAIADHWRDTRPAHPIIIAGSTGATPATRTLMAAALEMPAGRVIFPGLDFAVDPVTWATIYKVPDHPQHTLAHTLEALGRDVPDVYLWPTSAPASARMARRKLVQESLAPASATANWLARLGELAGDDEVAAFARKGFSGLSILTATDEGEEAMLAALLLRETLENEEKTSALITPDATLARRVSAHLKRWDITLSPSAGTPLLRTPAGRLLSLVYHWACDPGDPVALLALIKHEFFQSTFDDSQIEALEREALRGPRWWQGLEDLANKFEHAAFAPLLTKLMAVLDVGQPLLKGEAVRGPVATDILGHLCGAITDPPGLIWRGDDGAATTRLLENLLEVTSDLPALTPTDFRDVLEDLATGITVTDPGNDHPRLAIWGPLEARLQSADRLILAGLNDGVWPATPPPDAFLPRRFRSTLGLALPETRLGLAAHDFAQLATAPDVTLLLSERREDAPAVASRWIWRLKTLAEGALGVDDAAKALAPRQERDPRPWADALNADPGLPADRHVMPCPRPPVAARPKRLSVTRVTTLQRDPYEIYGDQILRLKRLDPLNAPVDARRRGTAIHTALETFEGLPTPAQTPNALTDLIEVALRQAGEPDEVIRSERAGRQRTATWYLNWRADRPNLAKTDLFLERRGTLTLDIGGMDFTLSAMADRIERSPDGTLAIIDFKTGQPPTNKVIASGLEQQMPLQALIAASGGFERVGSASVRELIYVAFKTKPMVRTVGPAPPDRLAEDARAGLEKLIGDYQRVDTPYLSAPRVQFRSKYESDFARLARRAEWAGDVTDDE